MSRETVKAELADKIVAGIVKSDFDPMEHIDKLDRDALRIVLFDRYVPEYYEAIGRIESRAMELAAAWLESDPRGSALLDEEMEKEAEFQADLASLNERERMANA